MSYSWQILKKELVRSVKGPGREEWCFEEGREMCKKGPTLYLLESHHGTRMEPGLGFRKTEPLPWRQLSP